MPGIVVHAAVEGTVDAELVRKLIRHVGGAAGDVYGQNGKAHLRKRIQGYIQAARFNPWLVLVDLDNDHDCAPQLRSAWIQQSAPAHLCFRVAVREVEAWLLADTEMIAAFLGVVQSRIPTRPEELDDPKATLVSLAARSRRREIRQDIVPHPASGRRVGPAYSSRMIEYTQGYWRPDVASTRADSLRRALENLRRLL